MGKLSYNDKLRTFPSRAMTQCESHYFQLPWQKLEVEHC